MNTNGTEGDDEVARFRSVFDGSKFDRSPTVAPVQPSPRPLPLYQPFVLMLVAFAAGIFAGRVFSFNWIWYVASCIGALTCSSFVIYSHVIRQRRSNSSRRREIPEIASSVFLLIAIAMCGAFWSHARWNWFGSADIGRFAAEVPGPVCLKAVAVSEPRPCAGEPPSVLEAIPRELRTSLTVRVQQIRDGQHWKAASGTIELVVKGDASHIFCGDEITIFGSMVRIGQPTNPGQFDFSGFYRGQGQMAVLRAYSPEAVVVTQKAGGWTSSRALSTLRRKLNRLTWEHISPERAGLASAILLGNREQLSRERRETFLLTGTVHLLAISGLHVGILAGLFFVLYRADLISRNTCLICTILFVVFYAWLVEFRPPVSRAAILIVLFCLARLIGRTSSSFNWLAIAGLLVLVINPADLFQVGPQLSFLAVATIVAGFRWIAPRKSSDPLQRLIDSTRPFPVRLLYWSGEKVRAAFLVSAIVWMVAMPLVAIRFHLSAPVALIVNPILLIPIALALYGGLGTLVFGSFFPPAGAICGRLCDWNLSVVEWCIALATNVPGGHSWTAGPAVVSVIAFYAGMFLFAVWPATRVSGKYVLIWVMCWTVFGWLVPQRILEARHRDAEHALVATFIDVGHGTSVLLQLPDGRNILYDAGSFGSANYAVQNVSSVLWHENVTHLDSVVVSHADVDHFNALPELMKRFSIGSLIVSYPMSNSDSESVAVLLEAARSNGIRVETVSSGDRLETDSLVDIKVLNPPEAGNGESDNADSIVLLIEHSEKRLLLTGDLEGDALFELMSGSPLPFDIAMAPHHGSLNSHPQTFARWCTPDYVVISGSVRKTGDEVTKQFESAGAEVLSTGLDGAVRFEIGEEVRARTWNDGGW